MSPFLKVATEVVLTEKSLKLNMVFAHIVGERGRKCYGGNGGAVTGVVNIRPPTIPPVECRRCRSNSKSTARKRGPYRDGDNIWKDKMAAIFFLRSRR